MAHNSEKENNSEPSSEEELDDAGFPEEFYNFNMKVLRPAPVFQVPLGLEPNEARAPPGETPPGPESTQPPPVNPPLPPLPRVVLLDQQPNLPPDFQQRLRDRKLRRMISQALAFEVQDVHHLFNVVHWKNQQCSFCSIRQLFFQNHPDCHFKPFFLKQQLLLERGFDVFFTRLQRHCGSDKKTTGRDAAQTGRGSGSGPAPSPSSCNEEDVAGPSGFRLSREQTNLSAQSIQEDLPGPSGCCAYTLPHFVNEPTPRDMPFLRTCRISGTIRNAVYDDGMDEEDEIVWRTVQADAETRRRGAVNIYVDEATDLGPWEQLIQRASEQEGAPRFVVHRQTAAASEARDAWNFQELRKRQNQQQGGARRVEPGGVSTLGQLSRLPRGGLLPERMQQRRAELNEPWNELELSEENSTNLPGRGSVHTAAWTRMPNFPIGDESEYQALIGEFCPHLPNDLARMLMQMMDELNRFWGETFKVMQKFILNPSTAMPFGCFVGHVHWLPDNKRMIIDRAATTNMILEASRAFGEAHELSVQTGFEFIMAATNMLEDQVRRLWPALDGRLRDRWSTGDAPSDDVHPLVHYWAANMARNRPLMASSVRRLLMTAVANQSGARSGASVDLALLETFYPQLPEIMAADEQSRLRDHLFHSAVSSGNLAACRFLWCQHCNEGHAPIRSMLSAATCCGSRYGFYSLFCCLPASESQQNQADAGVGENEENVIFMDARGGQSTRVKRSASTPVTREEMRTSQMFEFLWSLLIEEERNAALLMDHAALFLSAVSRGLYRPAFAMWNAAGRNQRFVLLHEGGCVAFREACAGGYLNIVLMMWSTMNDKERRELLTVGQNSAFISACANGRLHVVTYLLSNLDAASKTLLVDSAFGRACEVSVRNGHSSLFFALKHSMPVAQYGRMAFANQRALLQALMEQTGLSEGGTEQPISRSNSTDPKPPGTTGEEPTARPAADGWSMVVQDDKPAVASKHKKNTGGDQSKNTAVFCFNGDVTDREALTCEVRYLLANADRYEAVPLSSSASFKSGDQSGSSNKQSSDQSTTSKHLQQMNDEQDEIDECEEEEEDASFDFDGVDDEGMTFDYGRLDELL